MSAGNGSDHLELLNAEVRHHAERLSSVESTVTEWNTILNQSVGALQGEFIRVTAALRDLTEEFKALRQELVNFKRTP